jgi:hypothetical protein
LFLQSFPAKGPVIQLDNITEVKELEQDGPRFPFEVHHKGKYSPWELRVYSEVQRREWKERIQMHPEATSPPLTRSEKEKEDIDASIDECIYDKIIDVLNNRFNPSQLDEFTKKLQTHTYSTLPAEGRILPTIKSPPMDQPALSLQKLPVVPPPPETELPLLPPKPPRKRLKEPLADKTLKQPSPTSTPEGSMFSLTVDPALPMLRKTQRSMSLPSVEPMPLDVGKLPTQSPQKPTATEDYEDMDSGLVSEQSSRLAPAQLLPPTLPPQRLTSSCASLEALQREALAISLSSLTDVTKIGEGQFGDVYTAKMNRCTVAVKVIKRYSSKRVKEQFENEMSIMSQVSHHNIVRLHGIIRDGPLSPALVMEFLRNGDLKTFLSVSHQNFDLHNNSFFWTVEGATNT